ncbi:TPA: DUF6543 domain-containing protein [Pseudomonas putida]
MKSLAPSFPAYDLCAAIARQFADRPTLRQVAGEQAMKLIHEHYPLVATHRPEMTNASPLYVLYNTPEGQPRHARLIDMLLGAMLNGAPVDFAGLGAYAFSLKPMTRFFAIEDGFETAEGDLVDPQPLTDAFNDLLLMLPSHLQQAQIDYWNGSAGADRDLWMQQVLRIGLMDGLNGLDDQDERQCLRELVMGDFNRINAQAVRVQMRLGERTFSELLPWLLVNTEVKGRQVVFWCSPDGDVRRFGSLHGFGRALQVQMAERYSFDSLSWTALTADGDAFSLQSALVLEILLNRIERVRRSELQGIEALEAAYSEACDPSQLFTGRIISAPAAALALPGGLKRASLDAQTGYLQAMLDLSLQQSASDGAQALDGIEDLQGYAARRLREELLHDHPDEANYFPGDLIITVDTFVSDGHGLGFGQKIDTRKLTLTALAIGRLDASVGGAVTHIEHRENQLIMDWMTVDYVHELIARVDIGGSYPGYVNEMLADQATRPARIASFTRQWRTTLMFDAARARVVDRLDAHAHAALVRFCRGHEQDSASIRIAPLAFKRSPTSQVVDVAHGMYVIEIIESGSHVLYTPLYTHKAIRQFPDAQALLSAISESGSLQDMALMWLDQEVRSIYDNGGFKEPHLPHWIFDPYAPLDKPEPAVLALQFWTSEVDRQLFEAKFQLMVEMADRTAPSNSTLRWGVVTAFGWELLNVVLPVLPGPLVSVAWLYMGIRGLVSDVQGFSSRDTGEKIQATVDILNNTLMAWVHLQLPKVDLPAPATEALLPDPLLAREVKQPWALPAAIQEAGGPLASLHGSERSHLDFSWRGLGGLNALSPGQRSRLRTLATDVSLTDVEPVTQGATAGFKALGDRLYIELAGDTYQVRSQDGGFQIVAPDQTAGPRLYNDGSGWRVDARLQGGSGRADKERLRNKLEAPAKRAVRGLQSALAGAQTATDEYLALNTQIKENGDNISKVEDRLASVAPADPEKLAQFEQMTKLFAAKKQTLLNERKALRRTRIDTIRTLMDHQLEAEGFVVQLLDNPSFQRANPSQEQQRKTLSDLRQSLIGYGLYFIEEQLGVGDFRRYQPLVEELTAAPQEQKPALYVRYTRMLEGMAEDQGRIIAVSDMLDRLLAVSAIDLSVKVNNTPMTVAQIIQQRKTTTVAIRFFQAMNHVELALKSFSGAKARHYNIFREALASQHLRVAANTHQLSLFCELSVNDRIEVLLSAWEAYGSAIINCDRIAGLGKALIDTQRLQAYKAQMELLKEHVGQAFVEVTRAQASGQSSSYRRPVYPPKSLQLAHTRAGQIVIGEEVVVNGEPILRVFPSFSSEVVHSFHRQGDTWVEESTSPAPERDSESRASTPESEQSGKDLAEGILKQNENVIKQAEAMVASDAYDVDLISLLDSQMGEVAELREQLQDVQMTGDLLERLDGAVQRLREVKRKCLIDLYSRTRYPGGRALNFLHQEQLIKVTYEKSRRVVSDGYLDEYKIELLKAPGEPRGKPLWAAHFHFADSQAAPSAFGKGHLKLWSQRRLGYKEQMRRAEAGQVLKIYRGNLTYAQARHAIPFNDY